MNNHDRAIIEVDLSSASNSSLFTAKLIYVFSKTPAVQPETQPPSTLQWRTS